ncbi:HIT family protein [Pelagibius litoralis]|uniref:HIT family protein n=1 Tax=Pelagibius litoralis TaxID=374515 RepID=A0A967F230_9PROT|nr:HIT family protein [Pelagibius litoralis]
MSSPPNATMTKFGFPETLVRDHRHWVVLLRPHQATLGALVLVCKDHARAFGDISAAAFGELQQVIQDIEAGLSAFRPYQKMNYLMLMMVDPDVHFHVLPRYDSDQLFDGTVYQDEGWPGAPLLSSGTTPDAATLADLAAAVKAAWPDASA